MCRIKWKKAREDEWEEDFYHKLLSDFSLLPPSSVINKLYVLCSLSRTQSEISWNTYAFHTTNSKDSLQTVEQRAEKMLIK
jgi:hypothetical protein